MFAWTPERNAELQEYVSSGLAASMIGEKFGISRSAVIGKCHRMKLQLQGIRPEKRADGIVRRTAQKREARVTLRRDTPAEVFIPTEVETPPLHKSLIELDYGDCRYPYGANPPFTYCGHIATFGSSYCAAHNRVVYRPFEVRSRKKVAA